jgi:hypothetical protein
VEEAIGIVGFEGSYPEFRIIRGDALARLSATDRAAVEDSYRAAARGARMIGARLIELGAIVRLAELQDEAAVGELPTLYATFTEGFDEPELVRARAVMGTE